MRILIVYDSVFGNTARLAKALAERYPGRVSALSCAEADATSVGQHDALVAASPTRAFSATPAIKQWLARLPAGSLRGRQVSAFDTRMDVVKVNNRFLSFMVRLFGYAAEPLLRQLERKGGSKALEPAGFFVTASEGPLAEGETERAAAWLRPLAEAAASQAR